MKRIFITIAFIFVSLAGIHAMNIKKALPPGDPSEMDRLWKDYEASRKADRPQKSLDILSDIKKLALDKRLPWDFYKAGRNFVDVSSERNWKLRSSLEEQFQAEIQQFDEPVLTFFNGLYSLDDKLGFIKKHRSTFESGRNPGFYSEDGNLMQMDFSPVLVKLIDNDLQYALWSTMLGSRYGDASIFEESRNLLSEVLKDNYPCEQFLELVPIYNMDDRFRQNEALEKFAYRYRTKAVSLLARQRLLENNYYSLEANGKATSEEYKALRDKLAAFEGDRKAFSTKEKEITECCGRVASIINSLDDKSIFFHVEKGSLVVLLRNLDEVGISITDRGKKNILSRTLKNEAGSYYVQDTIRMDLPEMNDGMYTIICKNGKIQEEQIYSRYSISMAQIHDAYGYAVYLADALTGEPVRKADMALIDDAGKTVAEYKGLDLNGFTYLPQDFTRHFNKDSWKNHLRFSYTDSEGMLHMTKNGRVTSSEKDEEEHAIRSYASVFTDRTAYTPGETVHFKIVSYYGDRTKELHTSAAGKKLKVKLFDAQGKEISSKDLTTGEFGSAAGEFMLERRERNGNYRIAVYEQNSILSSVSLRVDDFVLPTFELNFDKRDRYWFPGDEVVVTGTVKSYSGHSLSSADVKYSVRSSYGDSIADNGILAVGDDGRFAIRFKTERVENRDFESFFINVKVTDATGETLGWNESVYVTSSIPFNTRLLNKADARVSDMAIKSMTNEYRQKEVADGGVFKIGMDLQISGDEKVLTREGLKISYSLKYGEKTVAEGRAVPGETLSLDTSDWPSGLYNFEAVATDTDIYGNSIKAESKFDIIKINESDMSLSFDVESIFKIVDSDGIALQIGSTNGPVWACIDLFGEDGKHLASRLVHLTGKKGAQGSLETVNFAKQPDWAGNISLRAFYFKDYSRYTYSHEFTIPVLSRQLPLSFTRFYDKTVPGAPYSLEISTEPDVECVASIFDKSTEEICRNIWNRVDLYLRSRFYVDCYYTVGTNSTEGKRMYRTMATGAMLKSANAAPMMLDEEADDVAYEMEESAAVYGNAEIPSPDGTPVPVRENFANTIAFEPFLRSDKNGKAVLSFTTADKLSTYYVQLFAHDRDMNNAVLRREMVVTIPVKVSVVEPLFLYEGDRYIVKVSLSSSEDQPASGRLLAEFYDGKEYRGATAIKTMSKEVRLEGMQSVGEEFEIEVPSVRDLGIKLSFVSDNSSYGSDAVFVSVPVFKSVQTVTEAHSAVLRHGDSKESLLTTLKSQFVNVSGEDAEFKEISILQMVKEAIPSKVEPESDNVVSISEALYTRLLARKLGAEVETAISDKELVTKLLNCRRPDGGFSWFAGMDSSPIVTAALLQRYASLRDREVISTESCRIPASTVAEAVRYLDYCYFSDKSRPEWRGGLGWEQYLSTRAMFPGVDFKTEGIDSKKLKEYKKEVRAFLTPKDERGLNSYILGKARRMQVLTDLSSSEEGKNLAKSWGIKLNTVGKLMKSLEKDLISIEEYAVEHDSGGIYYPNAVMPYRGLLESEAYAHSFICDLLSECAERMDNNDDAVKNAGRIADGIRVWLMIQKETQKWDDDAAFVNAISSVLDGSEEVLGTKVISLAKTFTKPFDEIKAAGNGFRIESLHFVERTVDGKVKMEEISEGEELAVGDRIKAEYRIWNGENRSFVKVTVPREACMRPTEQLSGRYGGNGYRSVKAEKTEFWFDSYPEEDSVISEEFYVTQAGSFQAPAVEIESLYAPHYRANGVSHRVVVK